jgi:protein-L-isoaspartate(D-aspartate) O-methyltransferase
MVQQQIKERGIRDKRVVRAMLSVKRHEFVPDRLKHLAYQDRPLPIGHDQTISQPYIVALMTWALNPDKNDKILEVGTGSGYQAAVLAEIVDQVYSVEIVEPLGEKAKKTLQNQGYNNVHVRIGDGYKGWEKYAPFDGIIVTCSPSEVPEPLKKQLAEGGRLVIPVGGPVYQELVLYEKKKGKLVKNEISSVRFVPMLDEEGNRY